VVIRPMVPGDGIYLETENLLTVVNLFLVPKINFGWEYEHMPISHVMLPRDTQPLHPRPAHCSSGPEKESRRSELDCTSCWREILL
jgi:hypothetical protein